MNIANVILIILGVMGAAPLIFAGCSHHRKLQRSLKGKRVAVGAAWETGSLSLSRDIPAQCAIELRAILEKNAAIVQEPLGSEALEAYLRAAKDGKPAPESDRDLTIALELNHAIFYSRPAHAAITAYYFDSSGRLLHSKALATQGVSQYQSESGIYAFRFLAQAAAQLTFTVGTKLPRTA